jgi:hypothetical protein
MSRVPFQDQGNLKDLYDLTVKEMQSAKVWDPNQSPKIFEIVSGIQQIDIFSTLTSAMNPMVFSSLMRPISKSWSVNSASKGLRQGFWTNRRSRSLNEAIPLAPEQTAHLIRGWFIATIMNLHKIDDEDESRGPKFSIWSSKDERYVDFPHPLLGLFNESIDSNPDLLPAILESIGLALAACNQVSTLDPLKPYWEMIAIGDDYKVLLKNWICSGSIKEGAPIPDQSVAGMSSDSFEVRKNSILKAIEKESQSLESIYLEDKKQEPWKISRATQIRDLTEDALDKIKGYVTSLVDQK